MEKNLIQLQLVKSWKLSKKLILVFVFLVLFLIASIYLFQQGTTAAVRPGNYGLKEGDVISAAGSDDPDIYIVNEHGYKRLFLNPVIFGFYGHLGGFANVKSVTPVTRDAFGTSGLFRNCEINDLRVYGLEVTAEDSGVLHWVNTSGSQAVADDPNFFKKVFCINNNEFNWYSKGVSYKSVEEVPSYERIPGTPTPTPAQTITPTPSITPTPTPTLTLTSTPTPIPGTSCTRFFFFSQIAQALFNSQTQNVNINTESVQILGPNVEYQWRSGGGIQRWQDPNNDAWAQPVQHPCPSGRTLTRAVLFVTISPDYLDEINPNTPFGEYGLTFKGQVEKWIQNVRNKYPTVNQIWISPVIGVQDDVICYHDGERVRASVNHPIITDILQEIASADPRVEMGGAFKLPDCGGYSDAAGHIIWGPYPYKANAGRDIANWYANVLDQ